MKYPSLVFITSADANSKPIVGIINLDEATDIKEQRKNASSEFSQQNN